MNRSLKSLPTLAMVALLGAGAAFATATPTATPAANAKPAMAHTRHPSALRCEQEARARKLTGAAEKNFVKECKEGKTTG
jgi:hypothetical protein